MLKVLILNPPRVDGFTVVREERYEHKDVGSVYPPLSLLYVSALLERANYNVKLIDANGFNISYKRLLSAGQEFSPDIIVTRIGFDTQFGDLDVLADLKEHLRCRLIVRNKIISEVESIKKNIMLKYPVDIFVNCEMETNILEILKVIDKKGQWKDVKGISFLKDGNLITTAEPDALKDVDTIPFPAYHLLPDFTPYHTGVLTSPFATIDTSKGCPYNCTFCAYRKNIYRFRKPEKVVEELVFLKDKFNVKNVLFFDDIIALKKGHLEKICELIIKEKLDVRWVCCTRANKVSLDLLKLMKKAGCVELAIGIESGSPKILENVNKGVTTDDIRRCAKLCKEAKVMFYGMTIIGLPGETKDTVFETIEFIKEIDPFYTQFCFATPFPNTPIYNYYKENNLLLTEDWSRFFPLANEPVIRTEELSKDDLIKLRSLAYKKTILRPKYLLSKFKMTDWKWNIEGAKKLTQRIWNILTNKPVR